jgi:hypothetical protein
MSKLATFYLFFCRSSVLLNNCPVWNVSRDIFSSREGEVNIRLDLRSPISHYCTCWIVIDRLRPNSWVRILNGLSTSGELHNSDPAFWSLTLVSQTSVRFFICDMPYWRTHLFFFHEDRSVRNVPKPHFDSWFLIFFLNLCFIALDLYFVWKCLCTLTLLSSLYTDHTFCFITTQHSMQAWNIFLSTDIGETLSLQTKDSTSTFVQQMRNMKETFRFPFLCMDPTMNP